MLVWSKHGGFPHIILVYDWKIFLAEYPLFYIPPSLHIILTHDTDIIAIKMMSEEAVEARTRDLGNYGLKQTREASKLHTMA